MTHHEIDLTNTAARRAATALEEILFQLFRRRTPEDALIVLKEYMERLGREKRWREITKGPYQNSPDLIEYLKELAAEAASQKITDETERGLFVAEHMLDLLKVLCELYRPDEHETFLKLSYEAMNTLLKAPPSEKTLKILDRLVYLHDDDVNRGARRAIQLADTEKAIYYINALKNRPYSTRVSPYYCYIESFWFSISGRERHYGLELWAPIMATVQDFQKFVDSFPYGERKFPVGKSEILTACHEHVKKMCTFAAAVRELPKVILESSVPIDKHHGKDIELIFDVEACIVTKITVPLYTGACDFYDQGTHNWRPIEEQKILVGGFKIMLREQLQAWSAKHNIILPEPKLTGELRPPEVKPEPIQEPAPVPVE